MNATLVPEISKSTINTNSSLLSWAIESEQNLISAALTESRAEIVREVSPQLSANDFFDETHQNIWRCRSSLADAGVAHDVAAVIDTAKKLGLFLGGTEYVMGLLHDEALKTTSDLAIRASAKRVKDYSIQRTFMATLLDAQTLAAGGTSTAQDVIAFVADSIENIRNSESFRTSGPMHVMHYVTGVIEGVSMRMDGEEPSTSVTTGFTGLDNRIGGLTDGDLIVLAARPSMGKTAISLAISEAAATAATSPRTVLYFSTEQGGLALAYRMVASRSRLDATELRRGVFDMQYFDRFDGAAREIGSMPIYIDETSEITLPEIRARSRAFAAKHGSILIVVDYLQRLAPHRVGDPRVIVGEISTGLKNLAKELRCPIVALAQLNRKTEERLNKRPGMADLGESGKIEQDADVIMLLYRDEYYNKDTTQDPGITEVIVAKNRDGATGMTRLAFNARNQHYDEV